MSRQSFEHRRAGRGGGKVGHRVQRTGQGRPCGFADADQVRAGPLGQVCCEQGGAAGRKKRHDHPARPGQRLKRVIGQGQGALVIDDMPRDVETRRAKLFRNIAAHMGSVKVYQRGIGVLLAD